MSANGKTDILTPKQELFLAYYVNPKSPTFSNAYQSALKAGFKEEYAKTITAQLPEWLADSISDTTRLRKAEKVLDKTLEEDYAIEPIIAEGEQIGEKINPALSKIQQDSAKFIAERLNKQKYSTRQELTGKDGESLGLSSKSDAELAKIAGLES